MEEPSQGKAMATVLIYWVITDATCWLDSLHSLSHSDPHKNLRVKAISITFVLEDQRSKAKTVTEAQVDSK